MDSSQSAQGTRRLAFVPLGIAFVSLGAVGIVVPGMPATVFLLAASYFFARSSPRLDRWLRENRWFGPYLKRFAIANGLSRRLKAAALLMMWASITISGFALDGAVAAQVLLVALGIAGTVAILFHVRTATEG